MVKKDIVMNIEMDIYILHNQIIQNNQGKYLKNYAMYTWTGCRGDNMWNM